MKIRVKKILKAGKFCNYILNKNTHKTLSDLIETVSSIDESMTKKETLQYWQNNGWIL